MHKDGGDDVGILDASDHPELAAAFGAGLDIDGEDPLQALHPGHGGEGCFGFLRTGFAFWHDGLTMPAIRGEHPMEAREVESWARDQGGETGDEVERFENDVGGSVAERLLERIDDLPSLVGREALIGDRRAVILPMLCAGRT